MREHKVSDRDRLFHIKEAIEFILSNTLNLTEDTFYRNELLKKATVRDLEVIGEAANYLSDHLKNRYAEVEWRQIISTRHRIIHEYFHVSYVSVWQIIKNDLPTLGKQINKIIEELD